MLLWTLDEKTLLCFDSLKLNVETSEAWVEAGGCVSRSCDP